MPCLVLRNGNRLVRHDLTDGAILGRGEDSAIRVIHASVSRHHARFDLHPAPTLTDLKSANGTMLDGDGVDQTVPLGDGMQVRFGDVAGWYFEEEPPFDLKRGPICSVCQWPVEPQQSMQRCDECGALYHRECWQENGGCGSYGCTQVGVASPASTDEPAGELELSAAGVRTAASPLPLAAAVLGSIVGVLTFGVPALAAAVWAATRRAWFAVGIGLLGTAVGLLVSGWWWLSAPV